MSAQRKTGMGWNSPSGKKFGLIVGAAIFAIVTAVFAVNCRNEFIRYDDYDYIVINRHLESGLTPRSVKWAIRAAGYASNWHPLAWMSHAADISLAKALGINWHAPENKHGVVIDRWSAFPVLVHAENVLWHAANAVLLWWLMMAVGRGGAPGTSRPTGDAVLAAGCALLWALHPLRVEVVAWAAERKELVSVFFMLLTLIAYAKGVGGSRSRTVVFSFLFFVLALLAKPVAVSLPAVLFAYELVFEGSSFRRAFRRTWPFMAASAVVCYLTMASQTIGLAGGRDWTWPTRIVCAVEAPAVYLWQTVWPFGLSPDYPIPTLAGSWPFFAGGVLLLLAMAAVCVWWLWRRAARPEVAPYLGWGVFVIAWAYVGLLPMSGLVKVGYEPHNDRYTYWIGCGVAFGVFAVVRMLRPLWERERVLLGRCLAAVLVICAALSVRQSLLWKSTSSIFGHIINLTKSDFFAQGLSEDLIANGGRAKLKEAEEMLRDVLSARHSDYARAILAYFLAAYCDASVPAGVLDVKDVGAFTEARLLAAYALEGTSADAHLYAYAAQAFADRREKKFRSAYENMKKAMDLGFKSQIIPVDLEEWKKEAEGAGEGEGSEK